MYASHIYGGSSGSGARYSAIYSSDVSGSSANIVVYDGIGQLGIGGLAYDWITSETVSLVSDKSLITCYISGS